ncbi:hypothetical protein PENSPDRAFT_751019 [Peniophora sp. CONT]|nr:hypothetical protein PENSPDRAFT_751019 [Peniophora sp. CONT]
MASSSEQQETTAEEDLALWKGRLETEPLVVLELWKAAFRRRSDPGIDNSIELLTITISISSLAQGAGSGDNKFVNGKPWAEPKIARLFATLRRNGLCTICEDIVKQPDFFDLFLPFVIAVFDIIESILVLELHLPVIDVAELQSLGECLIRSLWVHRRYLLEGGATLDAPAQFGGQKEFSLRLRTTVVDLLAPFLFELAHKQNWGAQDDLRRIGLFCWLHTESHEADILPTHIFKPMLPRGVKPDPATMLDLEKGPLSEVVRFTTQEAIPAYGVEPILRRLRRTLHAAWIVDVKLVALLQGVSLPLLDDQMAAKLASTGVLLAWRDAVDRQYRDGTDATSNWQVLSFTLRVFSVVTSSVPIADGAAHLVRECGVIELVARAIRMYPDLNAMLRGSALEECLKSVSAYKTFAAAMNMRSGKNTLRKTFKQQMHHEWYPTLQYLRGHPSHNLVGTDKLLAAWDELGMTTGLSEEQEKAEHAREAKKAAAQRAHHCAWKECKYHTVKHPMPTSLRACSGCGVVRYCSRECQRKDWKSGHKGNCKRIKDAEGAYV